MLWAYYPCKFCAAITFYRGTRAITLALGFGFLLGVLPPHSGLLLWLLLLLACFIPMNHLCAITMALCTRFLAGLLLPLQVGVGSWLLQSALLFPFFRLFDNLPLLPWFYLTRADVLGALILGLTAGALLSLAGQLMPEALARLVGKWWRQMEARLPQLFQLLRSKKLQDLKSEYTQAKEVLHLAESFYSKDSRRVTASPSQESAPSS